MTQLNHTKLFKNHGESIGYWEAWTTEDGLVHMRHARKLDGKTVSHPYQAEGKNIGKANETTPKQQAHAELISRIKKQMDKGYVLTMEEAKLPCTNSLGLLKPMLATPFDKVKPEKIDWSNTYVQPKLDGHRALFVDGVLYSRQGIELDIPHITEAIKSSGLDHLHLDGELYIHGYTLQELSALIKKDQPGTDHLEYHIYDVVDDRPFIDRMSGFAKDINKEKLHPRIRPVYTVTAERQDIVTHYHNQFRFEGYEGTMLRFGNEGYRDGKRSRTLLKIKEFKDSEFKIIGVEDGKPVTKDTTYQVPVWVLDAGNGETFTCIAQGNMKERHALWETRKDHIGKQLTVKYHYLSKLGIPQLPVALRFHETV